MGTGLSSLKHPGILPSQGTVHIAGTSNWTFPLDFPLFSPAWSLQLHSITRMLHVCHSFIQLGFFLKPNSQRWQKSSHVSCPSLHLLLGVQWQIPVLLCANVTAVFTADLRVYIGPRCYLPVSLILSAGNPSYVVEVDAPVLKEFVSISAGTNPPWAKPLCRICSNSYFDKGVLSTSTRRDCFFSDALGSRCVGSCLYLADNWDEASM